MDAPGPTLFDRPLLRRRLARALAGAYPAFLLDRARDDLADRLAAVTRDFPRALDLGTPTPAAADLLGTDERVGEVVRLAPQGLTGECLPPGRHAEERPEAASRSTHPGRASFETPATRAPQDEDGGSVRPGVEGRRALTLVGDEEALPFAPGSFGLVVSLLSLQAVNDLPGVFAQVRRVLAPDGLFLACLLGGESLRELRAALTEAETETAGGASPRVAPFAEVKAVGGLLQRAGFALPVVDVDRVVVRYASPFGLLDDLRAMGLANVLVERRRVPMRRATLMRAAAIYAERFADPDGRVRATFDLVWLSGWTPHESQQKPLAPGSARTRLADALGVPELGPDALAGDRS